MNPVYNTFIDIHTHRAHDAHQQSFQLTNILLPGQTIPDEGWYSAGVHPWHLGQVQPNNVLNLLKNVSLHQRVVALGECGLDRAIHTPLQQQAEVFEMHLQLATELGKPLIIHAVRAYSDVLQLLKKHKHQLPLIFHDYHGNPQQTRELLRFNSYFSLGEHALNHPGIKECLASIPSDRLFFETDDSPVSIEKIYLRAASMLGYSLEELVKQVSDNFRKIFSDELVKQN